MQTIHERSGGKKRNIFHNICTILRLILSATYLGEQTTASSVNLGNTHNNL